MTLNCNGQLIDLSQPKVMGILNITPDSFYDGGKIKGLNNALRHSEKMLSEGATFIDVGGYSSRPGADDIDEQEELQRVLPVVKSLLKEFPSVLLSIDTFRSKVAKHCLEIGGTMINDISAGGLDDKMMETVADFQVPYIMMHMKGSPQTMKQQTAYEDLIGEILFYFSKRIAMARTLHINDIIVDPGFGFAKNSEQNYVLLKKLDLLQMIELPVLVGLSRKSMIYKKLNLDAKNALNGTTALNMIALQKGANILRVHDVKEAVECTKLIQELY